MVFFLIFFPLFLPMLNEKKKKKPNSKTPKTPHGKLQTGDIFIFFLLIEVELAYLWIKKNYHLGQFGFICSVEDVC